MNCSYNQLRIIMCSSMQIYGLLFQIFPSEVEMEEDWVSAAEVLGVSSEWLLSGSVNSLFMYWNRLLGFLLFAGGTKERNILWVQISLYESHHCFAWIHLENVLIYSKEFSISIVVIIMNNRNQVLSAIKPKFNNSNPTCACKTWLERLTLSVLMDVVLLENNRNIYSTLYWI